MSTNPHALCYDLLPPTDVGSLTILLVIRPMSKGAKWIIYCLLLCVIYI